RAAYERMNDKIYPGILALLSRQIAALHELGASPYQNDVDALLNSMQSIAEKERAYVESGWEHACPQDGGDAWRSWDSGAANARADDIATIRNRLVQLQCVLGESEDLLRRPAPQVGHTHLSIVRFFTANHLTQ
ncbi:MAG TPA: hypothetical protein VFW25_06915, partial [Silvibacterium sp.]|nr:hypothetical protein [Silvibacterium sp.]